MSYKFCCDDFAVAFRGDPQIDEKPVYAYQGKWHFNCDAMVMKYCPFCGVELRAPAPWFEPPQAKPGEKP
jgi:hypothetical protein